MYLNEKEQTMILELSNRGHSSREISRILWGVDSRKSTVNDFLARTEETLQTAKIWVYDIETSPSIGYFWRRFKETIGESQIIQNPHLLTWAGKWYGDSNIVSRMITETGHDAASGNDKELAEELSEYLSKADIIVAHNGDRFDAPTLNARLVKHGLNPPDPHKSVDTLKIAKANFRFPSNSLDSIARYLDIEQEKIKVDFSLWRRVMEGEPGAIEEMAEYNEMDVIVLEEVYTKLRPYDKRHPNVSLKSSLDMPSCPKCGSVDIREIEKKSQTNLSLFQSYRCNSCGGLSRGRKNLIDKDSRESVLMNIV